MTLFELLINRGLNLNDEIVIEHQYMNWDSGEKNKVGMPIYDVEYKDGKIVIKCGEE